MPLYKSIAVNDSTHVLIWKITESEDLLKQGLFLGENSTNRLSSMKYEMHRRAYLSVRHLLAIAQYTDTDLTYSYEGKPSLSDGVYISITHSYEYAAVIFSEFPVGIDIEKQRDKILKISNKFATDKELKYVTDSTNQIVVLTAIWGAKEALYKLYGVVGLSFKQHIDVAPFNANTPYTKVSVNYLEKAVFYNTDILHFNGFTCVYVTTN